jgi:peptidoglycan/xylan/chitin deacetylase (PgdA/CDA1 family)
VTRRPESRRGRRRSSFDRGPAIERRRSSGAARRLAPLGIGVGLGVAAAAAVHTAPSLIALSSIGRHIAPALAGVGDRGHVALTFDDGPDPASTPAVLEALDALGWRATFFMLGEMVRKAPGLAADVAAAGHEVAVHGDTHRTLLRLGPRTTRDDIQRAVDEVAAATGTRPAWYRPPFGTLSVGGLLAARSLDLQVVLWTAWGRDWRAEATGASVAGDVLDGFVAGGTVLLHDSDCTSAPESWRATLDALPLLGKGFADRGLVVGPVGEHGITTSR